jgi:hypothetical protein
MDITQLLITIGAVVGIVIVGLLAIVPTVIELPERAPRRSTLVRQSPSYAPPGHGEPNRAGPLSPRPVSLGPLTPSPVVPSG